jgi:RNA polymerase sigma factor (sigma-70 family)
VEGVALSEDTPSQSAARRDAGHALAVALTTLRPRQREAVSLVYLHELSLAEAAARMGTTRQAVHSLVYRGLQGLREVLGSLSDYLSRR